MSCQSVTIRSPFHPPPEFRPSPMNTPGSKTTFVIREDWVEVDVFWKILQHVGRLHDEGDVTLLACKQKQCWPISQETVTTRMSEDTNSSARKLEEAPHQALYHRRLHPLTITTAHRPEQSENNKSYIQTRSHHKMAPVQVSHPIPFTTAAAHP